MKILLSLLLILTMAADVMAQTTQPAGRGRGFGRRPATTPSEILDADTGQWYTPMQHYEYTPSAQISLRFCTLEGRGKQFKDLDGQVKPGLKIFRDNGYNWVRYRVCVEPATLPQNTEYTIASAQAAKKLGFKFLLDIHYSNAWADPTNEPTPAAWQATSLIRKRVQAVYEYTRDTIAAMAKADVLPGHHPGRQRSRQRHDVAERKAAGELGSVRRLYPRRHQRHRRRARGNGKRLARHRP